MLMNNLDVFFEKNPLYAFYRGKILEGVITKFYKEYFHKFNNKHVLEIGCGSGFDTKLISIYFKPSKIIATDLDSQLIEVANKRNKTPSVFYEVADSTKLLYKINSFDAIFDFGVIHHIPNWKDCLKELYCVLKPGGFVFLYDVPIESFSGVKGWFTRTFTLHPYEEIYRKKEFVNYIRKIGFKIISQTDYKTNMNYFVIIAEK